MSKWSRLKMAALTASLSLPALMVGSCLGANWWGRMQQYLAIAQLLD
jgi:hypothetical protein